MQRISDAWFSLLRAGKTLALVRVRFPASNRGFTLIELMVVIAILGTLAAIATPNYLGFRDKAKNIQSLSEIKTIEGAISSFLADKGRLPNTLAEAGLGTPLDAWGNPYVYYPVDSVPKGHLRKDKFLVPVNTDYDLYSMGADGKSSPPFTAKHSRDDIVRANNGAYFGPAGNY